MKKTKKQKIQSENRRQQLLENLYQFENQIPNQSSQINLSEIESLQEIEIPKGKTLAVSKNTNDYSYLKKDLTKIAVLTFLAFIIQFLIFFILKFKIL